MRYRHLSLITFLVSFPGCVTATAILTNVPTGVALDGYEGWIQSQPNLDFESGLSFGVEVGDFQGAAVGGYFAEYGPDAIEYPIGSSYSISHAVGGSYQSFSMDFSIRDTEGIISDDDGITYLNHRNDFSVSLGNAFEVTFIADNPDFSINTTNDTWSIFLNGVDTGVAVIEQGLFTMDVQFTINGANLDYSFYLATALGNSPFTQSGTLAGETSTEFDKLTFGTSLNPLDPQWGDNYFAFTNIQVQVPEPGSVTLLGLAAAGMLLRRRR